MKLTNPEWILMGEGIYGCGLRDPSPCPVCGTLTNYLPDSWTASDGFYHAYFCAKHNPWDLEGTPFAMSANYKKFLLTTMQQAHQVGQCWRRDYDEWIALGLPSMKAWDNVDELMDYLDEVNGRKASRYYS